MNRKDDELGRTMLRNVLLKRLNTYPPMSSYYSDSESFYPMGSDFTEEGDSMIRENELRQLLKEQVNRDLKSSLCNSTFTEFILCSLCSKDSSNYSCFSDRFRNNVFRLSGSSSCEW